MNRKMHKIYFKRVGYKFQGIAFIIITGILLMVSNPAFSRDYSWKKSYATVSETGDLQWAPEPFVYEAGDEIRYIDYENGDDSNDGMSKSSPWKHHPWDSRAEGNAGNESGAVTYVFKRGVTYRCYEAPGSSGHNHPFLEADESGERDNPICLTSDPSWGTGEAIIAGSIEIPKNWQKAMPGDVPFRMDTAGVWYIDVSEWYPKHPQWPGNGLINVTTLFEVSEGVTNDLHIARDPDWQEPGKNFANDYWHQLEGWKQMTKMDSACNPVPDGEGGYEKTMFAFDDSLVGYPCDYFLGGTIWSHYGSFMGTPTPKTIDYGHYSPDSGGIKPPHYQFNEGTRYMFENLPQFLDNENEYYYDEDWSDTTGRLFIRLSGNRNPNTAQIEISSTYASVTIQDQSNIYISGLTFTRNGFSGNVITVTGNSSFITIKNCLFDHTANNAIQFECDGTGDIMDSILIADNDFFEVKSRSINISGRSRGDTSKSWHLKGELKHVDVLRNRLRNIGFRHNGGWTSNVPAIGVKFPNTATIAGNMIHRSFGSGLVVFGGKEGNLDHVGYKIPLTRILVYNNKIEHAALGVNDYGGLALWQGGPIFSFNNISGNSVGHLPGGLWGSGTTNLSYPLYLDGGFKIYNFNNILWGRKYNPADPYSSVRAAYFNVFGYLNPFVNNTIVGTAKGFGGTSGNRNDLNGNLLVDISKEFISSNHGGNPSLIGGGDDAESGIDGASSLAYSNNIFYGDAVAGTLVTIDRGAEKDIESDAISIMSLQMQEYPLRCGNLGTDVGDELPIRSTLPDKENPSASEADFRLVQGSAAINNGINYFIPWSLYATVGEWHFNRNDGRPEQVLDYHFYMTEAYFHRSIYYKIPAFELEVDTATTASYVFSPSEDWTAGALLFDGTRYAACPHTKMTDDIRLTINDWWDGDTSDLPPLPWEYPEPSGGYDSKGAPVFGDDQVMIYPGELRRTPDIDTCNLLIEANVRIDSLHASSKSVIAGKYDGNTGYQLFANSSGTIEFMVSSGGDQYSVATAQACNDHQWHHVLAEIDRKTGAMHIYLDGALSNESAASLPPGAALSNSADFIVGKDGTSDAYFYGALDFLRVCQGTLKDAQTTIGELYEWQTNGPVKYDFAGNAPIGQRDVGALEAGSEDNDLPDVLMAWDFEGEGDTTRSKADFYHEAISESNPGGLIEMGNGLSPTSWAWPDGFTFKVNDSALTEAIESNAYVEFSILPKEGKIIDLTRITMNMMNQSSNTPRQYALFSEKLPFIAGNEIDSDTLIKGKTATINLNGFNNITDTLTFRIYYFGTNDGKLGGIYGKLGYDLMIEGNVKNFFEINVNDSVHQYIVKTYGESAATIEHEVFNNGKSLQINGNGYQKVDMAYEVTPFSVLEFDYSSEDEGSVQGVLFDNDGLLQTEDEDNAVQIHGTTDWAKRSGIAYSGSGTQHFIIELGQFFTGSFTELVFLAKDQSWQLQQETFHNISFYEDSTIQVPETIVQQSTDKAVILWPNPVKETMTIRSSAKIEKIEVLSAVSGRVQIIKNNINSKETTITVDDLIPGVYYTAIYNKDGDRHVVKIIKIE